MDIILKLIYSHYLGHFSWFPVMEPEDFFVEFELTQSDVETLDIYQVHLESASGQMATLLTEKDYDKNRLTRGLDEVRLELMTRPGPCFPVRCKLIVKKRSVEKTMGN